MHRPGTMLFILGFPLIGAGCTSDDYVRTQGVTTGAGNAIAANTVMQMVDPWPRGVQNTDLITPADLRQYRQAAAANSGATSETDSSVAAEP